MSGTKYVLKNNTTLVQFFDYKTLSNAMWDYQVQLNPGQIKTIWAENGTLKIYNNGAITIEEQSSFPPPHVTGGNNGTNTYIDYTNKSILVFSVLPNSTNLGYSILDFDNNVIVGPIDLGYNNNNVVGGYWYVDDIYPFTNSGYAIYLYNDDNCDRAAIYLDYRGTIIGQYSASTCSSEYDMFGGKYSYFTDYINGIVVYSDGKTFNSFEFNTDYNFNVNYNYDGCTKDGFIIDTQLTNYASFSIVTMDGITPLTSWNTDNTSVEMFEYENSNFYTTLNYITADNIYLSLNIYSSNGVILHSVNLTQDNDYNNFDLTFFGTNKMNIIFYNDGEGGSSFGYLIYTYDGETNTLISTTHENNGNYPSWTQHYDSLYGGDTNFPSQDFHISFYYYIDENYDFYITSYYDVLSYFSGDTEYRTPYVINNDDTTIRIAKNNEFLGSSLMFFYNNGDGYIKLLVITGDDVFTTNVTPSGPLDTYNFNTWWVGDTFIFMTFTDYTSSGTLYAYDAMGNQLDYKLFYDGWDFVNYSYGTLVIQTNPSSYYFNTTNSKFTSIGSYYPYTSNWYYTDTFKETSNILLIRYDMDNTYARLLTDDNLTPEVILPQTYNEPSYFVGKDVILYIYFKQNMDVVINLYNTSFGLLQSVTTNYSYWNNVEVVENRVLVQIQDSGTYLNYMVSANGIKMVESTTNQNRLTPNDYYNWW